MTDILSRAARAADRVLVGSRGADDVVEVYAPRGERRGSLLLVHGGFWRARFDRTHLRPFAEFFADRGWLVALPEYLRAGQAGGGWPGTLDDLARIATETSATLGVPAGEWVVAGHSAGGHLAILAAERVRFARVVSLAGVLDLAACAADGLSNDAAGEFLGSADAETVRAADPMQQAVPSVDIALVHGDLDGDVPVEYSTRYATRRDDITLALLPGAGHFAVIDPEDPSFAAVVDAVEGR
ncbi:S9 family peptidase [Microbacterium sp. G2-8]|uniref:alpha/beta hydrolase family protein n=1 Tax=Microbacterium sp. G2-8 TaxID=2842454 RepID=UPI001C89C559|nr:alpha/beta hydrolase [Microbacterium sp. G2-8]